MPTIDEVIAQIESAFAGTPRPRDEDLLDPPCYDDTDIQDFYGVVHWREAPDDIVENGWAALYFMGPEGFRHFIPAYMRFALRHHDSGYASVESAILALSPAFTQSPHKYAGFSPNERDAVVAFLEKMAALTDWYPQVWDALEWWSEGWGGQPSHDEVAS